MARATNGVSLRFMRDCSEPTASALPINSYTSIAPSNPRTSISWDAPSRTLPPAIEAVAAVTSGIPGRAACSIRAARCTVGPEAT